MWAGFSMLVDSVECTKIVTMLTLVCRNLTYRL